MARAFIGLDLSSGATTADIWRFLQFFDPAPDQQVDIVDRDDGGHIIGLRIWYEMVDLRGQLHDWCGPGPGIPSTDAITDPTTK
jgi:hypothetical protein